MKLIASLFLMVVLALNGPGFCAHSLAMETAAPCQHHISSIDDDDHAHMAHSMTHQDHEMPEERSSHCPEGCGDGDECHGCMAVSFAVLSNVSIQMHTSPEVTLVGLTDGQLQTSIPFEPPPPKRLF